MTLLSHEGRFLYTGDMRISFVVPAYNEEAGVERSLKAILSEIERTGADAEVVLVNNASTDRTREIAEAIAEVRVIDELQKGLVRARSAGHSATTGDLVAHVDSDTLMPEGWLSKVLTEFERDNNLVALSGPYIYYDLPWYSRVVVKFWYFLGYVSHLFNHHVLKSGAMLQGGNFIIRRDAWDKAGGFDTTIEFYGEDTDVARRLTQHGRVKWSWSLHTHTSGRRLKSEGMLKAGWNYFTNYFSILLFKRPATQMYKDIRD